MDVLCFAMRKVVQHRTAKMNCEGVETMWDAMRRSFDMWNARGMMIGFRPVPRWRWNLLLLSEEGQ